MFRTGDLIRVKKQVGYAATGTACDRDPSEEGLFTTSSNFGDDIPSNVVSTFVVIATANALAYALLASGARRAIRRPAVQRAVNRTGGGFLVAAGLLTVLWRRQPT